jgi:5-methylcytosine-specific restriction endonuclease McrA
MGSLAPDYPGCNLRCESDGSVCGSYGDCQFKTVFNNLVNRRTRTSNERCNKFDIKPLSKDIVKTLFQDAANKQLRCPYCGEVMSFTSSRDNYRMAISIDHTIPFANGGTNTLDNLKAICTRCNLVKGTMKEKHFVFIQKALMKEWGRKEMLEWLEDAYSHAQAYKIERMNVEKAKIP